MIMSQDYQVVLTSLKECYGRRLCISLAALYSLH